MMQIVLAIFIASQGSFEAALPLDGAYVGRSFPNTDAGLEQLARWVAESGVTEFDHVCVTSPPAIGVTPAFRFFTTRNAPVFLLYYGQVERHMSENQISEPSAEVVARTCIAVLQQVRPQ